MELPEDEEGGADTDATAAPVGARVPVTGRRPGYKASRGGRRRAPGSEAAAGDRDGAEGPSPALQASTFVGLLAEAVVWTAALATRRYGGRRGRGKSNVDEGRVRKAGIREVSEGFLCTTFSSS